MVFSVSDAASMAKHLADTAASAQEIVDVKPSGSFLDKDYWNTWAKNMETSTAMVENIAEESLKNDLGAMVNKGQNIEQNPSLARNILGANIAGNMRPSPTTEAPEVTPNITMNMTFNVNGVTDRTDKRALAKEIASLIQEEIRRETGTRASRGRLL